jgi:flagellar motility protein MotE (MotC chaperone)
MIIATITALIIIFGGSGLEFYLTNLKGPVKEHVQDKERQENIFDASKALSKNLKQLRKRTDANFGDLIKVHGDYQSAEADFAEVTDRLLENQKEVSKLILDARDAMHGQMTKEEWEAVFKPED